MNVYTYRHFLVRLQGVDETMRESMIKQILSRQMDAIAVVAKCVLDGTINPSRRDSHTLNRYRSILRILSSSDISSKEKKTSLLKYHNVIPILLHPIYLMDVIAKDPIT